MNLQSEIARRVADAIADAWPDAADADPLVLPAQNPAFGDYQANFAMSLAKRLKRNPREIASAVAERIDRGTMLAEPEIAGPGFINLRVEPGFLAGHLARIADDERLGASGDVEPQTIVVDFSSPNTCKPMHVGHIRSIVIGDAICRLLRFLGHRVIADNHLGDWGTQFGLLIAGFEEYGDQVPDEGGEPLGRLVAIYKLANARAEEDEAFAERARAELAKLHAGDAENLARWRQFSEWSWTHLSRMYERLGAHFDKVLGESFYNDMLPGVVRELTERGIARESQGAMCVFWDDDSLPPMLVRKRDGAFLYATTDLATLKYRREEFDPDQVVYVTDSRQQLHFRQVFDAARRWSVAGRMDLKHVWFGTILGADGTPLKTRSGDLVPLEDLLDEAERRAREIVRQKSSDLPDDEAAGVARSVGIGAIKYADLSQNRQSDVVFDWDKMLAMQGNTAPYLQYAYARIRSIFRRGAETVGDAEHAEIVLDAPEERALALKLARLPEALESATADYRLNLVCNYLYELSSVFTGFYEACPVLKSEPGVRASRLRLCELTARTLKTGLDLLGIEAPERM